MAFFKKSVPKTPIWLKSGDAIRFATLDNKTGYYSTDDPLVIAALQKCQKEERGGITEIDADEFENDFAKKKPSSPQLPPVQDRESFGAGIAPDTTATRIVPRTVVPAGPEKPAPVEATVEEPSKPRVGKRPVVPE